MKKKDIPVFIKGRQVLLVEDGPLIKERVYKQLRRIYAIYKVYHVPGKRMVVVETKPSKPYVVRGHD